MNTVLIRHILRTDRFNLDVLPRDLSRHSARVSLVYMCATRTVVIFQEVIG